MAGLVAVTKALKPFGDLAHTTLGERLGTKALVGHPDQSGIQITSRRGNRIRSGQIRRGGPHNQTLGERITQRVTTGSVEDSGVVVRGRRGNRLRAMGNVGKAFATRDQNSSIGTTTTRRGPVGEGQRPTLQARSGAFAGKTRGVGRKESRDQNSSPKVQTVQARTLSGQFASGEMKLHVVHPKGRVSRQPKTSALGHYRKGRGAETRGHVEKGDTSQATGVVMHESLYGRGNSRFGGAGTRGRKLS